MPMTMTFWAKTKIPRNVKKTQIATYDKNGVEIIVEKGFREETSGKETTWKT